MFDNRNISLATILPLLLPHAIGPIAMQSSFVSDAVHVDYVQWYVFQNLFGPLQSAVVDYCLSKGWRC